MPLPIPYDLTFPDRAIALGRQGLGRSEIASRFGLSIAELDTLAAAHPDLARALTRAETEARAWWEALPREALANGARFGHLAWREAMAVRFPEPAPPPGPPEPRVTFIFPDNGRDRKLKRQREREARLRGESP